MNLGGIAAALDGGKSYTQNEKNGQKKRTSYEQGHYVVYLRLPAKEKEAQMETEKALTGNRIAILAAESGQVFQKAGVHIVSPHEDDQQLEN